MNTYPHTEILKKIEEMVDEKLNYVEIIETFYAKKCYENRYTTTKYYYKLDENGHLMLDSKVIVKYSSEGGRNIEYFDNIKNEYIKDLKMNGKYGRVSKDDLKNIRYDFSSKSIIFDYTF